jgi:anaerobic selenocysteine-containing dehydrogenase
MREFHPWPLVKVSPQTAEEYSLIEGDWLWIENGQGRFKQKVKIDPTLNPMYIHAEHGWWYPEEEPAAPHLYGTFDSNINNITHTYETGPGGIGCPYKSPACKIYKVTEENSKVLPGEQITRLGGFTTWPVGKPF